MGRGTARERFWDKVHCEPNTGCWLWAGAERGAGYGTFWHSGKHVRAHRFSYEMHVGPIPEGLWILHTCDVRPCVNPDHLYTGTHADNMRDMCEKKRHAQGEQRYMSKLTDQDVREIRELRGRFTQSALAEMYGVARANISHIQARKIWAHVLPTPTGPDTPEDG